MNSAPEKIYRTRVTKKALLYALIPFASAILLAHFAMDAAKKFAPQDTSRYFFVGVPAFISASIVISLLLVANHFLNREITVNGNDLSYRDSKTYMQLNIAEMAYSPPSEKTMLKTIMFSDGLHFIQIPEVFLGTPAFVELCDIIKKIRRQRDLSDQKTYSL